MDSYHANQVTSLRHFSGHYRPKGKWVWGFSCGNWKRCFTIGSTLYSTDCKTYRKRASKTGCSRNCRCSLKEKVTKTGPEKHSLKHHKKQTVGRTQKLQQQPRKQIGSRSNKLTKKRKTSFISKSRAPKRSRSDFFAKGER